MSRSSLAVRSGPQPCCSTGYGPPQGSDAARLRAPPSPLPVAGERSRQRCSPAELAAREGRIARHRIDDGNLLDREVGNDLDLVLVGDQHLFDAHAPLEFLAVLGLEHEHHAFLDLDRMVISGGASSLPRTCLRVKFPANREEYREFRAFCRFESALFLVASAQSQCPAIAPVSGTNRNRELTRNVLGN